MVLNKKVSIIEMKYSFSRRNKIFYIILFYLGQATLSSLSMPRSGAIQGVINLDFPGVNDYESLGLFFGKL